MATYGPEIDQSQHAKSASHLIIRVVIFLPIQTKIARCTMHFSEPRSEFCFPKFKQD